MLAEQIEALERGHSVSVTASQLRCLRLAAKHLHIEIHHHTGTRFHITAKEKQH